MHQKQKKYLLIFIILILSLPIFDYSSPSLFQFIVKNITNAFYVTLFIFSISVYYARNKKAYFALAITCIAGYATILVFDHNGQVVYGLLGAALMQVIIWPFYYFTTYKYHSYDLRALSIIGVGFHGLSIVSYLISKGFYVQYGLYFDLYYFISLTYVLYIANWNRLVQRLQKELVEVREIKEKREVELEHQLQIARQVQARTLPKGNEIKDVNIALRYEPLWQVGGDFCSIILPGTTFFEKQLRESRELSHCGLLVGDVIGKGPAAALIMSDIIASTQMMGYGRIKPSETLQKLNERLYVKEGTNLPYLATACYLAIDIDLKEFTVASAGHEPPLMYRVETGELDIIKTHGVMLGVDIDVGEYEEKKIKYKKGDKLILYTDGLVDMMPSSISMKNLIKQFGNLSANEMMSSLSPYLPNKENVTEHYDDYLIIILEFEGE